MKPKFPFILSITSMLFFLCIQFANAQQHNHLADTGSAVVIPDRSLFNLSYWFGFLELPFLLIALTYAFATANALRGGKFGNGMKLIAWGFVVMAVGHAHMQIEHLYQINIFKDLLGETAGSIAWFIALVITWALSGMGFHSIYKASKGK